MLLRDRLWRDVRYGFRTLLRSLGTSAVIVSTLAVAIGATTIIFSTIDTVWHLIPIRNSDRLVFVSSTDPRPSQSQSGMSGGLALTGTSVPDLMDWSAQSTTVEQFGGFRFGSATLIGLAGGPLRVSTARTTTNLFSMWGIAPALGRSFNAGDGRIGAEPVTMLSHPFWQQQFSSDAAVIGKGILLDGVAHTVVGVLPDDASAGVFGQTQLFVAHPLDAARSARDERRLFMTARLKQGVTQEQASADLQAIAGRLQKEYPRTNAQTSVVVRPLIEMVGGETPFLTFLLVLVAVLVVVTACANVSNVVLSQHAARQRELSLRAALGASRLDHIKQIMIEGFLISAAAGATGVFLGWWGLMGLKWLAGSNELFGTMTMNGRVLLVSVLTSFLVPFGFALLPALRSWRPDPMDLKEGTRSAGAGPGFRMRNTLVAIQVGLAMILMITISLMATTAWKFRTAETGFDPTQVVTFRLELSDKAYSDPEMSSRFYDNLLTRIAALPGVASAAAINRLPVADREMSVRVAVEGAAPVAPEALPFAALATVSRDYFQVMRVPVTAGRRLADADFGPGSPVALVSQEAARLFWPDRDPLGKQIAVIAPTLPDTPLLVVGIVANVRNSDIDQRVMPQIYVPSSWHPDRAMALVVRSNTGDPLQLIPSIRALTAQLDPNQPIFAVESMEQVLFDDLAGTYILASLLGAIALIALCLAGAGIYGVISYSVSLRTREIGVRMAIGAKPSGVTRMVIGRGAIPVTTGGLLGLAAAVPLAQIMSDSISEVDPRDPTNYVAVIVAIAVVAFAASYGPARRAARVDPIEALRAE